MNNSAMLIHGSSDWWEIVPTNSCEAFVFSKEKLENPLIAEIQERIERDEGYTIVKYKGPRDCRRTDSHGGSSILVVPNIVDGHPISGFCADIGGWADIDEDGKLYDWQGCWNQVIISTGIRFIDGTCFHYAFKENNASTNYLILSPDVEYISTGKTRLFRRSGLDSIVCQNTLTEENGPSQWGYDDFYVHKSILFASQDRKEDESFGFVDNPFATNKRICLLKDCRIVSRKDKGCLFLYEDRCEFVAETYNFLNKTIRWNTYDEISIDYESSVSSSLSTIHISTGLECISVSASSQEVRKAYKTFIHLKKWKQVQHTTPALLSSDRYVFSIEHCFLYGSRKKGTLLVRENKCVFMPEDAEQQAKEIRWSNFDALSVRAETEKILGPLSKHILHLSSENDSISVVSSFRKIANACEIFGLRKQERSKEKSLLKHEQERKRKKILAARKERDEQLQNVTWGYIDSDGNFTTDNNAGQLFEQAMQPKPQKNVSFRWTSDGRIRSVQSITPHKITGARFTDILLPSKFGTPFQAWCSIMGLKTATFEQNRFTRAAKTLKPMQFSYIQSYERKTGVPSEDYALYDYESDGYDCFPDEKIFGGSWDVVSFNDEYSVNRIYCLRTTNAKNRIFWNRQPLGVPLDKVLKGALYAYLLGRSYVYVVVSYLTETDYDAPDQYICSDYNTQIIEVPLHKISPDFKTQYIDKAVQWWKDYVETGVSPRLTPVIDDETELQLRKVITDRDDFTEHSHVVSTKKSYDDFDWSEYAEPIEDIARGYGFSIDDDGHWVENRESDY